MIEGNFFKCKFFDIYLCSSVYPFVKIGSGYNGEEWSIMIQRLDALLKPYNASNYPFASDLSGQDRPDLLVTDPHQSIVVQLKGAQLWTSKAFKAVGYTLRHPRFVKLRLDRSPDSSLTLAGQSISSTKNPFSYFCRSSKIV